MLSGTTLTSGLTLLGKIREVFKALAAQLLVAFCWLHLPAPFASFVQCLVSILTVSQCLKHLHSRS